MLFHKKIKNNKNYDPSNCTINMWEFHVSNGLSFSPSSRQGDAFKITIVKTKHVLP